MGVTLRRVLVPALCGGLLLAAYVFIRPSQLGGPVTFAVVSGRSMQPSLAVGDLVLVREASDYAPGEVVAYRTESGALILHRIVRSLPGGGFVLAGDANGYEDPYLPGPDEIAGRMSVRIPRAGYAVEALRQPAFASLVVGLVAFVVCRRSLAASGWAPGAKAA